MIDKRTIIHKLATKYNFPLEVVEGIVNYQFKFVSKIMKEGDFEAIRLPYFGKFSVNSNRVKYITKLKDEATR
tara:strand:+ start:92 stop:310 length:219 start_codon:yes stop_codon:yes gene_type:complete